MLDKLSAITRIIEKIKRFPVTFESMREWMRYENIEISDRTLYRYLEEIKNLPLNDGRIITIDGDFNKKTWKFEYDRSSHEFGESDIKSFLLLKNLAPHGLTEKRKDSIVKIEEVLYKAQSKSKFEYHMQPLPTEQITTSNFNEYVYSETEQQSLDTLIWAMQHGRKIKITELTSDPRSQSSKSSYPIMILLPMQILYHNGGIFLLGLNEKDSRVHALDLIRIKKFDILENLFTAQKYQDIFDLEIGKRFGIEDNYLPEVHDIILEFSSCTGKYISSRFWHRTQKFRPLSNGKWELHLICGINNELVDWVFGWGSNVKVIEPQALHIKLKEKLIAMMDSYLHLSQ